MSVHFKTMVLHLNPVRAFMSKPDPSRNAQQVSIWMEHLDGRVVLEGTASVGLRPGEMVTEVNKRMSGSKPVRGRLLFQRQAIGTRSLTKEPMSIGESETIHPPRSPL